MRRDIAVQRAALICVTLLGFFRSSYSLLFPYNILRESCEPSRS